MRWVLFICLYISLFIIKAQSFVYAQSEYVLPYPSVMPGSIFYKLHLAKEWLVKYWYFGDFGQFHFNLKQSDKYLVEAKTLFDYKQHLLGHRALQKSDRYFEKIYPNLSAAKNKGKNISEKERILKEATRKHIYELTKLKSTVPSTFDWTPERDSPTTLKLWKGMDASIKLRQKRL